MKSYILYSLAIIAGSVMLAGQTRAQTDNGDQVMGQNGNCKEVRVAGQPAACSGKGIMYMRLANGTGIYLAPLSEGRTIAFIGEKDAQPDLRRYHLYLSRIRIETRGSSQVVQVAGQCIASMPAHQPVIKRLECAAEDENRKPYKLSFIGQ